MNRKLLGRMLHAVTLGVVKVVDDTKTVQRIQVSEGAICPDGSEAITDQAPHLAHFGFSSNPPIGADVVVVRIFGNRTLTLALGSNHAPSRLKNLQPGDSALYDQRGAYMWLTENGLLIDGAALPAIVRNVGTLTVEGDIHCTGDVVSRSSGTPVSLNNLHDVYNEHEHGGVAAGSAKTQVTDHLA